MNEKITLNKDHGWINVIENGVTNDGINTVDEQLQNIILAADEESILFFPKGNYLFEKGITINKRLTLLGESNYGDNDLDNFADTTNFITRAVPNISIIHITGANQYIKNINFYSDSCTMQVNQSPPEDGEIKFRHILKIRYKNVSAVSSSTGLDGQSRFEHLYIQGFSNCGIQIPSSSNANNILIDTCGLGLQADTNTLLSSIKVRRCKNGMDITTGVNLYNVRIGEIQEVGINNTGKGMNLIQNLLVDQCGYCGFKFKSMCDSKITGLFTRCCQSYYGIDPDTYMQMDEKVDEAYALFYGDTLDNCNIELINHNDCVWEDENDTKHKIYIIKADKTTNVFLRCNAETDKFVQSAKGDLLLEHSKNTYKFYDGEICSIGGVQISENAKGDYIKMEDGIVTIPGNLNDIKIATLPLNSVLTSMTDSVQELEKQHGGKWENIGSKNVGGTTVFYYKKIGR